MAEVPGWTQGEFLEDEAEIKYDQYDRLVGQCASSALIALSADLDEQESRQGELTPSEIDALYDLFEVDWLGSLMVPPEEAYLDNRLEVNDQFRALHAALPFAEAERWWLLTKAIHSFGLYTRPNQPERHEPGYLDPVLEETKVMIVNGVEKTVEARELLHRFWLWRRELGDYSAGEGLREARLALSALIDLLSPQL